MGRRAGVEDAKLAHLGDPEADGVFSELERLVLRYAEAMTRNPADVPEPLFQSLRQQLGPRALVELTASIAWENFRARLNRPFGIEAAGFSEGASCPLPEPGPNIHDP